ncbi:FAD:protein FMN transferase [Corallincola spongiicola]|uniref:FAD:protein FMN transferase n=1 Tax=Corallincola spongiicola TaxID=2520508 RepID=A0ABY1WS51_9GAMM|nr:FAD:protein FMN transferase [Corallincola spongiicola]TAA47561.1 FAD:protein FMN transferase ApbE [Corallincola spongiicola]
MPIQSLTKWLALFGLAFFISACGPSHTPPEAVRLAGSTMGTFYHITLVVDNPLQDTAALQKQIDQRLELVNDQMSTYRQDSELSRFNQYQGLQPFTVSAATSEVVKEALRLGEQTKGALDVTIGPLVNLWGFGPQARPEETPTAAEIAEAKARMGYQQLTVTAAHSLQKSAVDLYVDLSAIAKGYGVDSVADLLDSLGYRNYLVEVGGELRTRGDNLQGNKWRIAVEKPDTQSRMVQRIIEPGDNAVATSGDYRNYFEDGGIRYSHTIDPETGHPINHRLVSATVIAPSCMTADGLATALMVMGPEKGRLFAEQHQLPVLMIVKTDDGFVEYTSPSFEQYLASQGS